ncbi:gluconate 2-dehydrogenase gamma chain (plasmid) [Ketogulonicigenium robustum]|uniref:Gluconate 2-dehydrogenase gamma chain n=2 Tax=Ketogulonicigenium robustum TaxID=92947 RepID=A0A1W6P3P8_9RHOB|nr:gluconate 2-dehydrogenase gamma chain [Ketogulonicigenium robustum]
MMGTAAIAAAAAMGLPYEKVSAAQVLNAAAPDLATYTPSFFTAAEFATLCAMCDRLIPADDVGPGALEANVPIFIDMQIGGDLGAEWYMQGPFPTDPSPLMGFQMPHRPQEYFRIGLDLTERAVQERYNTGFADLTDDQKDEFLTAMDKGEVDFTPYGEDYVTGKFFFSQVLAETRNGYLSDPMYGGNKGMGAWIMLGYPGARASFREWVGQHNVKYPLGPVSVTGMRA